MVFRSPIYFNPDEQVITWSQCFKDKLPNRSFTFWEWLYSYMKLTKDKLAGPWMDGLIHGFISKERAKELLSNRPLGTFICRFSESQLGKQNVFPFALTHI